MRLTPAQIAVHLICGHNLPMGPPYTLQECVAEGRRFLATLAGVDYEYDLQRWHDHLKVSRQGGYTWNRAIALPRIMREALASPEWHEAVRAIRDRTS